MSATFSANSTSFVVWGFGWVGNCLVSLCWGMLGGKTCGGDGGWRFSGTQMWIVECFGPFPIQYFPYPFCPCISHTHWTNCLPPIRPVFFVPLISLNNGTRAPNAWYWELLLYIAYIAPSDWLMISPIKCFWPVCWAVSGQASGLVRSMTYAAFPWLWEVSRDLPL